MERITEQPSNYHRLEKMSVDKLITNIGKEENNRIVNVRLVNNNVVNRSVGMLMEKRGFTNYDEAK